ncbi:unnamed protein product, partial [Pleuronectes platessa]
TTRSFGHDEVGNLYTPIHSSTHITVWCCDSAQLFINTLDVCTKASGVANDIMKQTEQKEQEKMTEKLQSLHVTPASVSPRVEAMKNHEIQDSSFKKRSRLHVKTGPPPVQ